MIDAEVTEALIGAYVGWNKLEKPHGIDVIDFYLIPPRKGENFKSREQVLARLKDLHSQIKPTNNQEEFIKAKVNASIYYIRALMGESIPFREYVKNITGLTPQLIPEKIVQEHRALLYERMKAVGYRPEGEKFEQFYERLRIKKDEALAQVERCKETILPDVQKILSFGDVKLQYEILPVEVDDYWGAWTSTKPDGTFLLRFNFHPDKKWRNGDIERLSIHEVTGHFIHGENLKASILKGELNPFIGVTTVQDPHTFSGEGTANALLHLPEVEKMLSKYSLLSRDRVITQHYLGNNAHIWMNEGRDPDDVLEYILSNDPFAIREITIKGLQRKRDDPSRMAYEYVYGLSHLIHRQFQQKLTPEKFLEYLRYAMTRYETPERLMRFVNQLSRI
jgi:hypothetical protein